MSAGTSVRNRRWILKSRPDGIPVAENFELREEPIAASGLGPGQVLVRNLYTLCAPDQRNWMNAQTNFHPPLNLGDTVSAPCISRIVASSEADYPVGRLALTLGGWADYALIDIRHLYVPLILYPEDVSPLTALAVLGFNQLAAYFGMLKVARPQPGDVLVVSGAAGSAGSAAAQIGKIKGCRVIGIAGGREKCDWLVRDCGLDVAIDYKSEPLAARLKELAGDRIDIFFDNVGGSVLQAAFDNMAPRGRIVLCGLISEYPGSGHMHGPDNFMRMVHGALRMEGFVAQTWISEFPQAIAELKDWVETGRLKHREDVRSGLENIPDIYPDLFKGKNNGTLVVRLSDED